jgi:AraC-like DNA-binding protein
MVCDRCIRSVQKIFDKHGIEHIRTVLGQVEIENPLLPNELSNIENALKAGGFELVDSSTPILVTKIKAALVTLFGQNEIPEDFKLSTFLTEKFPYDYSHLSRVFSHHEKDTIEHYLIRLRIEKAKELLTYNDINVSEVAYNLGYASAAHFSRQFKKMVGISPSVFQKKSSDRKSLEEI